MASASEWLARCDWAKRAPEFGELGVSQLADTRTGVIEEVPTMSLGPGVWASEQLWSLWAKLPPHPLILRVNRPGLLQFAALDWTLRRIHVGQNAGDDRLLSEWAIEIANTLEVVQIRTQGFGAWFACPFVQLDLEWEIRIGFISPGRDSWPIERLPPELGTDWPSCDHRAWVFAAGQAIKQLTSALDPQSILGKIIARATDPDPWQRYQDLEHLTAALRETGARSRVRASVRSARTVWNLLEQGLGFYMFGDRHAALIRFQRALEKNPKFVTSRELRDLAAIPQDRIVSGELDSVLRPWPLPPWAGDPLQRNEPLAEMPVPRVFAYANGAMAKSVIATKPIVVAVAPPDPLEFALRSRDYRTALELVDTLLAATPDDARAHHLRGKALFALGRIADARAAFDRACTLKPALLEAMLLRREMDRAMKDAGTSNRVVLKLPDHLAELRDILVAGRIVDAIQLLRRPAYDDDRTAQLLLAELLVTDERLDDALVIFDRLGEPIGKARTLLALDRPAEALVALTTDADHALELRAKILLALNRGDEAERAMDEYLRAVERRSDRRVESR